MRRVGLGILAASLLAVASPLPFLGWALSALGLGVILVEGSARRAAAVGLATLVLCIALGLLGVGVSGALRVPPVLAAYEPLLATLAALAPWVAAVPPLSSHAFPAARPWALAAAGLLAAAALLLGALVASGTSGGDGILLALALPAALCLAVAWARAFIHRPPREA